MHFCSPVSLEFIDCGPARGTVLVVDSHPDDLAATLRILGDAGYQATGSIGFEDGRAMLKAVEPLMLISTIRLGRFNGLHLVARARISHPELPAIVTHHVFDPVLEAEARLQGATFLVLPRPGAALIEAVRAAWDAASAPRNHSRQIIQS